jgi:mannonate dehydratase
MRFAEIIVEPQPTPFWRQLGQLGVEDAVVALPRGFQDWRQGRIDHPWSYNSIALYQELLAEENLRVAVIEDNPPLDAIRYGRPGREEELEQVFTLLRAMGRLGIPTWCYNWIASLGWIRTQMALRGRGGALVAGYDHALLDHTESSLHGPIDAGPLWENLIWFLERVLPVAEDAGVRLALHPDDPPVPEVRGIARVINDGSAYERLFERLPSPANAMTLCQGNLTLTSDDLPALIRRFGAEGRIAFAHFRDVEGTPERFVETFHDNGKTDMLECMRAYHDVGYTGVMRSDHVPLLAGDTQRTPGYSDQGRLFAIGYMTGLREAVQSASKGHTR